MRSLSTDSSVTQFEWTVEISTPGNRSRRNGCQMSTRITSSSTPDGTDIGTLNDIWITHFSVPKRRLNVRFVEMTLAWIHSVQIPPLVEFDTQRARWVPGSPHAARQRVLDRRESHWIGTPPEAIRISDTSTTARIGRGLGSSGRRSPKGMTGLGGSSDDGVHVKRQLYSCQRQACHPPMSNGRPLYHSSKSIGNV